MEIDGRYMGSYVRPANLKNGAQKSSVRGLMISTIDISILNNCKISILSQIGWLKPDDYIFVGNTFIH